MEDSRSVRGAALAFEHLPVPALLLDGDDRLVRANAAARAAFGEPAAGTPLASLAEGVTSTALGEDGLRAAFLLEADAERLAELARGGAEAGSLAHEIKNASSAVNLALAALARQLGEDEEAVLRDLSERLAGVERRIRAALSDRRG